MPENEPKSGPSGVKMWRAISIGLIAGIAAHAVFSHPRKIPTPPGVSVRGPDLPPQDRRLDTILDTVDFDQVNLEQALASLTFRGGLNFVVDRDRNASVGIEMGRLVSLHLKHATVAEALDAMLYAADPKTDLDWDESSGTITVSTQDMISRSFMRFYDVSPILANVGPDDYSDGRVERLKEAIAMHILTASWGQNGGSAGSISSWGDTLIVTQTVRAHRQIEVFLRSQATGGARATTE